MAVTAKQLIPESDSNTPGQYGPLASFHGGFEALDKEYAYWCDNVEGEIPKDLHGTLFRNGPGRMRIGDDTFGHWFDGDGMICAVTFKNGQVHFKNRYVRTPKYRHETAANKVLYRGFGHMRPGGRWKNIGRVTPNPANTSVVYHGGKFLALWEGGKPFQLDPSDLATLGEYDFNQRLSPFDCFSAHGKLNERNGFYYNFGQGFAGFGIKGPRHCIDVYKVSRGGHIVDRLKIPVDGMTFAHDFALTENYAVFFIGSIVMDGLLDAMLGRKNFADIVRFDRKQAARVLVVDIKAMKLVEEFEIDPMAVVHYSNAFERNGEIIVDLMQFEDFDVNDQLRDVFHAKAFAGGDFTRYVINLKQPSIRGERVSQARLPCEFPAWDRRLTGYENQVAYSVASVDNGTPGFFNSIQKVCMDKGTADIYDFGPSRFTSEALFVPRNEKAKEDDGYLISIVYDARRHLSEVVVLDASLQGELARVPLRHHVPHQFHGMFYNEVFI